MEEMLAFIADKMKAAGIPYEFGDRYEDGCTTGVLTVDIWSRESKLSAVRTADRIAAAFEDLQEVRDDLLFFVHFTGSETIPSGEMGLFRVEVSLSVSMWKGR